MASPGLLGMDYPDITAWGRPAIVPAPTHLGADRFAMDDCWLLQPCSEFFTRQADLLVLAHLGGLDEVGVFVGAALLAIVALRWVERKARHQAEEQDEEPVDVE